MSYDWIKPGTKIQCTNELTVDNPFVKGRPFTVKVGREAVIARIGPGECRRTQEADFFTLVSELPNEAEALCVIEDVRVGDIVVGWFDFGTGTRAGYINQLRGDFTYFWEAKGVALPRSRDQTAMILDRHPDRPGGPIQPRTGSKDHVKYLGYWASSHDPDADSYAQRGIVLPWPADFVDNTWNAQTRAMVVKYLKEAPDVEFWWGCSQCRFQCGIGANGSRDKGDGTYVWPEGFAHYVEVHGVKPPQEFILHVYASHGVMAGCFGEV